MDILAVADKPSHYLETVFSRKARPKFDLVLSCGDLDSAYLEFLADATGRVVHYVDGNHDLRPGRADDARCRLTECSAGPGGVLLHARLVATESCLLCGFGGALLAAPGPGHFTERRMRACVRQVAWQLRWRRVWERICRQAPKPLIVISHAPPAGIHDLPETYSHQGFACFRRFIEKHHPVLWLHGHVHLNAFNQVVKTEHARTLVLNVYEFKRIRLHSGGIEISYQL